MAVRVVRAVTLVSGRMRLMVVPVVLVALRVLREAGLSVRRVRPVPVVRVTAALVAPVVRAAMVVTVVPAVPVARRPMAVPTVRPVRWARRPVVRSAVTVAPVVPVSTPRA